MAHSYKCMAKSEGSRRVSPWERLRREAKAGRALSDQGDARRLPCLTAQKLNTMAKPSRPNAAKPHKH
jgi:hypothetical protein